jgi:hypothetical protein
MVTMRRLGILGAASSLLLFQVMVIASTATQAGTDAPTADGIWRQVDESGKVGALVTITHEGDVFVGRLSRLFIDPGDNPNPVARTVQATNTINRSLAWFSLMG